MHWNSHFKKNFKKNFKKCVNKDVAILTRSTWLIVPSMNWNCVLFLSAVDACFGAHIDVFDSSRRDTVWLQTEHVHVKAFKHAS